MGTKNDPGAYDCYAAAEPDEPMFILLARDAIAAGMVEAWAINRSAEIDRGQRPETDRAQVKEAYQCAKAMREWRDKREKDLAAKPGE